MPANSLRPQVVQVMAAHRERPFTTEEIYEHIASSGVADFDPRAKRDRNLVNRELSDLAGCSAGSHSKPSPQFLIRVGRGRYIFNDCSAPWTWPWSRSTWSPGRSMRNGHPAAGGTATAANTFPTRSGSPSTRCSGASAPGAASTSPIS